MTHEEDVERFDLVGELVSTRPDRRQVGQVAPDKLDPGGRSPLVHGGFEPGERLGCFGLIATEHEDAGAVFEQGLTRLLSDAGVASRHLVARGSAFDLDG